MNSKSNTLVGLRDSSKEFLVETYGKPIEEIISIAHRNLENAGFSKENIDFLLSFSSGVISAYKNDIPDYIKQYIKDGYEVLAVNDLLDE